MAIDRKIFFDGIRSSPFSGKLTKSQVKGISDLLDEWEQREFTDLRWLAYILGGVFHEVGGLMIPVREGFAKTDAQARAHVARLFRAGKISRDYALPKNGISCYGRGRIQNTHWYNLVKLEKRFGVSFTTEPDLLLDSIIDARVTVIGHVEGIWTGKKLTDYFNNDVSDWRNARRIVNGTDKADLIAGYAKQFHSDLIEASS